MSLVDYGIQTDKSDFRAHVGFTVGAVYVFPTKNGLAATVQRNYPSRMAWQSGVSRPTAKGYIVPWKDISECQEFNIPSMYLSALNCQRTNSTSKKGQDAVTIVRVMLLEGRIALPLYWQEVTDLNMQVSGFDITLSQSVNIQVKCDYRCGDVARGGTGNLFLQVQERNPLKCY